MTAMPQERNERTLITVIGLSILLVVLIVGYLAYQTISPVEDATEQETTGETSAVLPGEDAGQDRTAPDPNSDEPDKEG